jgi:hypothetical protein
VAPYAADPYGDPAEEGAECVGVGAGPYNGARRKDGRDSGDGADSYDGVGS